MKVAVVKRAIVAVVVGLALGTAPLVPVTAAVAAADVTPPTFVSGSVDKSTFNLADGPATFTVTVKASDPSGVDTPVITVGSTTTGQSAGFGEMDLVAGTTKNGTWKRTVTIPTDAAPGTWNVTLFPLDDTLGNGSSDFKTIATITLTNKPTLPTGSVTVPAAAQVGVQLTAKVAGWPTGAKLTYQWLANGSELKGASSKTYTPAAATVGERLSVRVTGSSEGYDSASITSAQTAAVSKGVLTTSIPVITGQPRVGSALKATAGTWTPGATLSYRWLSNGTAIAGATNATFVPSAAQVGKKLSVEVTGTLTGYMSQTRTSSSTAAVAKGVLTAPTPTVSGTASVGKTLTAKTGTWTSGTTLSYQWFAGSTAIGGATKPALVLSADQLGKKISVRVTGVLTGYSSASRTSVATAAVSKGTLTAQTPSVVGTAKVSAVLTAKPGTWTAGTTFTYQWFAAGKAIPGATKPTFVPTTSQIGLKISAQVTGSLKGYSTTAKVSSETAPVIR